MIETKEELYKAATEQNLFVYGDPEHIENGIDYSHIHFLVETGKLGPLQLGSALKVWEVLNPTIEHFMQKLITNGEDSKDLKEENRDWKESYEHLATELRIARRYIAQKPKREQRFLKYRGKELRELQKEMKRQVEAYEAAKLEKENEELIQQD